RSAFEMHHLLNLAPRGVDGLRQLAARADAAGDCDQKARRGWNLRHGRRQALGPVGGDHAREDDPIRIEKRSLEHRVLQTRGREPRPFECFEAEVRDELSAPLVERGARLLVDEEALLAVKQQRRRPCCAAGRSRHAWHRTYNGKVIVPSWSVRRTLGGKPAASRPDDLDAISCVLVVIALCSSSGERRLRPPRGRSRNVHAPRRRLAAIVCASRSRSLKSQKLLPSPATARSPM